MSELKLAVHVGGVVSTNGYFIDFGEVSLVIDAPKGMHDFVQEFDRKPSALLLTHQHYDHVEDAHLFEKDGVAIYSHSAYREELILLELAKRWDPSLEVVPYEVQHVLEGEEMISIEETKIGLLPVPGHSPDSLVYYLAGKQMLFAGDTLFAGSIGRTDLPFGEHQTLLDAVETQLMVMDDEVVVFPGHGEVTTIGEERASNPYL